MKIKLLIVGLLATVYTLQAQESPAFVTKNEQLQQDFYDEALGTTGLLLSFDYLYTNPKERFSLEYPIIALHQNGTNVYNEQEVVLALQANTWAKAQFFIPYRKINLFKGEQKNISLSIKLNDWWNYNQTINYQQPQRFKIDLQVRKGDVKETLIPYDKGGPIKEWLPDPYFVLTTNGGTTPLFKSEVAFNQYKLPMPSISIYVLEGEQLQWSFYDRDGAEDQLLGIYNDFNNEGTIYEDYYGIMFGAIRNLDFTYSRKAQTPQAINIYSNPNYEYQGKRGVALTIKYDLPEAYIGQQAQPVFDFYDKNGIRLNIPVVYPLNEAVEIKKKMRLKRRGKIQYFVPFYVWKEACHSVEFSFLRQDGERIQAAHHFLRQTIKFDSWVQNADLRVLQEATFQGAKGVKLIVNYKVSEVYENAPLYVKFYRSDGSAFPSDIFYLEGNNKRIVVKKEHKINTPQVTDQLSYFIPYSVLDNEIITVRAELLPDVAMTIFEKFTPVLTRKGRAKDIQLSLSKVEQRFRSNDYGQVIELKANIPVFYQKETQLCLDIKENGEMSQKILVEGAAWQQNNCYTVKNDSGYVYLILPHRNVETGSQFQVNAYVVDSQKKRLMSDSIEWTWKAPKELFNIPIEVELVACKFDKKFLKDTSLYKKNIWQYVIEVGSDTLVQEVLNQQYNKSKNKFSKTLHINREDNIIVKLVNTQTKRATTLWKGDLSKWEQSNFKTTVEKKYPIKVARIVAKVPADSNKNR